MKRPNNSSTIPLARSKPIEHFRGLSKEILVLNTGLIKEEKLREANDFEELSMYCEERNIFQLKTRFNKLEFNPDKQDQHGNTLLHKAVEFECLEAINFLIDQGCNVNIKNVEK